MTRRADGDRRKPGTKSQRAGGAVLCLYTRLYYEAAGTQAKGDAARRGSNARTWSHQEVRKTCRLSKQALISLAHDLDQINVQLASTTWAGQAKTPKAYVIVRGLFPGWGPTDKWS